MGNAAAGMGMSLGFGLIGAAIGGQVGFAVGAMVGGIAGSLLFPPEGQGTGDGPRLSDLTVQTSTYGSAIPITYGTVRIAGNVIWSTGLIEAITTHDGPGKGGSQPQTTTYSYSASFALSLCNNPIVGIKRIWADDRLWFDFSNPPVGVSFDYELFTGTETQLPCSAIEADRGAGNVPGFRGQAYIVFKNLQLAQFGSRIPNFHFEVMAAGTTAITPQFYTDSTNVYGFFNRVEIDLETGLVWYTRGYQNRVIVVTPELALVQDIAGEMSDPLMLSYQPPFMYISQGLGGATLKEMPPRMYVGVRRPGLISIGGAGAASITTRDYRVYLNNALNTLPGVPVSPFQPEAGLVEVDMRTIETTGISMEGAPMVVFGQTGGKNLYPWSIMIGDGFGMLAEPPIGPLSNETLLSGQDMVTGDDFIYLLSGQGIVYGMQRQYIVLARSVKLYDAFFNSMDRMVYDHSENMLYVMGSDWSGNSDSHLMKVSPDLQTVHWNITRTIIQAFQTIDVHPQTGALYALSQNFGGNWFLHEIDKTNGAYISTHEVQNTAGKIWMDMKIYPYSMFAMVAFVMGGGSGTNGIARVPLTPAPTSSAPTLQTVVQDISARTGLAPGDIDASALSTDTVTGYAIANRMPARQAIEPLMRGYFFDGVESDHLTKFVKRGGASIKTIPAVDTGAHGIGDAPPPQRERVRQEENELPWQVDVQYMDVASFYKINTQYARRLVGASKTALTSNIAAVFTATQAKRIADVLLYNAWMERQTATMKLTRKYLDLDPTDLVTFTDDANQGTVYRIVRAEYSHPNVLDLGLVEDDPTVYTQYAVGIGAELPVQTIPTLANTLLYFLDTSIMGRQADDDIGFYFAGGPAFGTGWPGAGLYRSDDSGATFNAVATFPGQATAGFASSALSYEGSIP